MKEWFTNIYHTNGFAGQESISGMGSSLIQTETIRKEIILLLEKLKIRRLLDAPCGDFFWMKEVELSIEQYIGLDIVQALIEKNQEKYSNEQRCFITGNLSSMELPQVDLILCRDCLVHFSFEYCFETIRNFKRSKSRYFLATTFTNRKINQELEKEIWRPLNLELAPFRFPLPLAVINENCTENGGQYNDKSLGLWLLDDINLEI